MIFSEKISTSQLIRWCQRVGMSIKAGLSMRKIWEGEAKRGSARHRRAMQIIHDAVGDGDSIISAMRETGYFPKLTLAMVEIGELTGKLDVALQKLGEHYEHQLAMRRQFLWGIAWPAGQLLFAVVLMGLLIYVFSIVASFSGSEPVDVTGLGLVGLSGMLYFYTMVALGVAIIALPLYALSQGKLGPAPVHAAMYLPLVGTAFRQLAMGRLTWSLGMALDAGMDAVRSVELSLDSTQNPFYISRAAHVKESIAETGCTFYEAFRDAGGFPDDFLDHLEAAEMAGTLSESLVRMSREYDDDAKRSLNTLTMVATGLIWMLVSGVLVYLIFRMFIKLYWEPMQGAFKELGM